MLDFLVQVPSEATAKANMPEWVDADGNWRNPTWCGILPVDAYTALGSPAVIGPDGETIIAPAVPPTKAPGAWFIVSVDRDVTVPKKAQAAIKAQADRDVGLTLPAGIVGLSTVWAGMRINP